MKFLATLLLVAPVAAVAQTAPPANVQMENGSPRSVTPTATYCLSGGAWVGCAPATGGGTTTATPTGTAGTPNAQVVSVQGVSGGTPQPVSGTFFQATQPVSATALPLPTGASTETTLSGLSGKLPASLGAKTGALSLSVVPNTDTPFQTLPQSSATSGVGAPPVANGTVATSLVLKASAGNLYGLNFVTTTAGYVMVFNTTTVPADGTVTPVKCLPLAANVGFIQAWPTPVYLSTGISVAFSTTGCFTKTTVAASAFISGDVR